ncbi:winged helix-turn-helix transcriptional regulator [archaeon]|nr:MAG: winged helix-turn-helix transcriptional regulator [archaeon]
MKFHNFPELVLGSKAKLKVLLYLLSEDTPTSEREISRILGISHTAVNKIIKDFNDANLVTPQRIGNIHIWKLNMESYAFVSITNLRHLANMPPLADLKDNLRILFSYPGIKDIIIFGSVAEGKEAVNSDIDVCILTEKNIKKDLAQELSKLEEKFIKRYGNVPSFRIYTVEEFKKLNKKLADNINKGMRVV